MNKLLDKTLTDDAAEPVSATTLRILASCQDKPGIVAKLSTSLADVGANIRESNQFTTDPREGKFFLRLVVDVDPEAVEDAGTAVAAVAEVFGMEYRISRQDKKKRMAILCSTADHCVLDLLWRAQTGDLNVEVPVVISNHEVLRPEVEGFGVPFVHVPAKKGDRSESEASIRKILRDNDVDFIVLARYMQILSDDFLENVGLPVINIHHSLLPAFVGAFPYRRAYERGVKIIGATAHYATPELDEGPIISQDVDHVGHTDDAAALQRHGKNIEMTVLARAVALHIEDRVHVHENRTIIHA